VRQVRQFRIASRRDVLVGALEGAAVLGLLTSTAGAVLSADDDRRSIAFWNLYRNIIGEAEPVEGKVALTLDEIAENGNNVPFEIAVESPMTDGDYVKSLYLLSTANPQPGVARFHFTPLSGKAAVKGRMRLARTQDVIALAEESNGAFLIATRRIEVTIGGCGN